MSTETTTNKAPAKRATAKKAPAKKATTKKTDISSFKDVADKAVNVYLGVIGKGVDAVQDNFEQARKDNQKRVKDLEKRGVKLRKELLKRFDNLEMPEMEDVIDDVKEQLNKAQDQVEEQISKAQEQVEDAVDTIKEKLTSLKEKAEEKVEEKAEEKAEA